MAVTIVDIANSLGVTHGTVSRALRNDVRIAEATRKRVHEAARVLGYQPNRLARQLVRNKTNMLSILVPDLANPFYAEYVKAIDLLVKERSYHLLPLNTHHNVEFERELVNWLPGQYVDGAICLEYDWHNSLSYDHLDCSKPLVVRTWESMSRSCQFSRVEVNYGQGQKQLIEHLAQRGCKKLGVVVTVTGAGICDVSWDNTLISSYRKAVCGTGIQLDLDCFRLVPLREGMRQYHAQVSDLLKRQPDTDALIVRNISWLPAVYRAIEEANKRVGVDIAVASFDNPPFAEYMNPGVTVVCEPVSKAAAELVRMLMVRLENENAPVESVKVDTELVIRDSTLLKVP